MTTLPSPRLIREIARDIRLNWPNPHYSVLPYLAAMERLYVITDYRYNDSAEVVILYFLSNAKHWRGPEAQRLKLELRAMLPKR